MSESLCKKRKCDTPINTPINTPTNIIFGNKITVFNGIEFLRTKRYSDESVVCDAKGNISFFHKDIYPNRKDDEDDDDEDDDDEDDNDDEEDDEEDDEVEGLNYDSLWTNIQDAVEHGMNNANQVTTTSSFPFCFGNNDIQVVCDTTFTLERTKKDHKEYTLIMRFFAPKQNYDFFFDEKTISEINAVFLENKLNEPKKTNQDESTITFELQLHDVNVYDVFKLIYSVFDERL